MSTLENLQPDLDNFHELVHAALAWEERYAEQQLREHAAGAPGVDADGVIGCAWMGSKFEAGMLRTSKNEVLFFS